MSNMKIVEPSVEILTPINGEEILKHIEKCGRVCYKSEGNITDDSAAKFVANIIKRGHESVLEHSSITVKFIVDRGISHEIVRHRLASYSQESTRWCDYSNDKFDGELSFIKPCFWGNDNKNYREWELDMVDAEATYKRMRQKGASPQEARSILPNSLKTELIMTANLREWRHFFKLRCAPAAHPQMREVALLLLTKMKFRIPVVFDDIGGD